MYAQKCQNKVKPKHFLGLGQGHLEMGKTLHACMMMPLKFGKKF